MGGCTATQLYGAGLVQTTTFFELLHSTGPCGKNIGKTTIMSCCADFI